MALSDRGVHARVGPGQGRMGARPAACPPDRACPTTRQPDDPRQAVLRARQSASRVTRGVAGYKRAMRNPPRLRHVILGCTVGVAIGIWAAIESTGLWLGISLVWAVGIATIGLLNWRAIRGGESVPDPFAFLGGTKESDDDFR